jgi:hypothetical protein
MNTTELKRFAQGARRKLLEQVGSKLSFVLTTDSPELREKTQQIKQLREELNVTTKEQLIEKVAYTWFNRMMALRFMDANDYQPLGIRIITPKDGYTSPELLDEAKRGNIPEELVVKRQKIYDLLDGKIPSTNPQNEAFKELLIAACNNLNTVFPFLFEKINDYTELLLPDDLTSDFSIVTDIRIGMPVDDCKNVEIIGWLYQYYISEKKDAVIDSKIKVIKEDIPAATQLFTPRWIVEYMVQNTVGKLWLLNRPKSRLREHMPYFIESESPATDGFIKISSPEDIKLLDPASGSGHILVYAFDLMSKIYEEEGYNISEIPKLIIEKNLFGYEIDERAAQLTGLALMMKAREYQHRVFRKTIQPNNLCFQDFSLSSSEVKETLNSLQIRISDMLMNDLLEIQQATNYGSLIIPNTDKEEISQLIEKLNILSINADVFLQSKINALITACNQLLILAEKFHCVVTNPPYMGARKMDKRLKDWLRLNYAQSYQDLFSSFIVRAQRFLHPFGIGGFITLHGWMFVSTFSEFRNWLLNHFSFQSLVHIGGNSFPTLNSQIARAVSFCFINHENDHNNITVSFDLDSVEKSHYVDKKLLFEDYLLKNKFTNRSFNTFNKVNRTTFLHSVPDEILQIFIEAKSFEEISKPRQGLATGNNERFVRFWFEINYNSYCRNAESKEDLWERRKKWIPYNKGGDYRKWYGNDMNCICFDQQSFEILSNQGNHLPSRHLYFKAGITYSLIGNTDFCARYYETGFAFDVGGSAFFPKNNERLFLLGLVNSTIGSFLLSKLNPTVNFQVGDIGCIPVLFPLSNETRFKIEQIVDECITLAKKEWGLYEESYGFIINEVINERTTQDFDAALDGSLIKRKVLLSKMFSDEIILDEEFSNLYRIDKKISDVPKKISLFSSPKLKSNSSIEKIIEGYSKSIIIDFISYSVGIIVGRYSIEKEGIILANQGETLQDYLQKIGKSRNECIFLPDEDSIIPMLDDEWFEDDGVGRFYKFLKIAFGENNFNKNLAFIEEQIGKDIRKYFIKDFYPDHIKRYSKRPIYWMFSSPKGSFNALIYMHRYTPDTVSNILNKYLKEFIGKLKTRKEHLEQIQVSGLPVEKIKAIKETDNIAKMLIELQEYERDILYPLATERISINLDDGVLINYNKFGKAVKEVDGLNDPATKKKVKQFDWIDTTQIR